MPPAEARSLLLRLYQTAVAAAHPSTCLPPALPAAPAGRVLVLAAGKAAGAMAEVAERHYLHTLGLAPERIHGIAVTRIGYGRPTCRIKLIEAGHPLPDQAGIDATARTLKLADTVEQDDLVLVLISGGASANWIAPADNVSLADKRKLTSTLLASGAAIGEINAVRKHLSRIKGGKLAARIARAMNGPARLVTLAISDVAGDDPSAIGSGPTVPDPTTLADARAILARYRIDVPPSIAAALADPKNETPKPGDGAFAGTSFEIVARPSEALVAAAAVARTAGLTSIVIGDRVEGEARAVADLHAGHALKLAHSGKPTALISGGELTVTLRGSGRGGPNQEYALALALALGGAPGIAALAADTDGTDGGSGRPTDPAGAFIDETSLSRASAIGLDPARFLADNDSTGFFERMGDLLTPGPTCTNVNDLRVVLVDT
ncbi:MAG TPA: glycerate kinase [Xanthobacteraceae bacterium]|nr:glycerate kinase [Xanthobacteraceae bacterium]